MRDSPAASARFTVMGPAPVAASVALVPSGNVSVIEGLRR
jgi:hypothetical protein